MQFVTFIIAVLSFAMSLATWISNIYNRSIRLHCDAIDWRCVSGGIVQLYIYFQNNSDKALTVSGLSLVYSGKKYPCELTNKKIRTVDDTVLYATPNFPLNFSPVQGRLEFIEFLNCPDMQLAPGKTIEIEIYTNRNRLKRFLVLPEQSHYLHLRNQ